MPVFIPSFFILMLPRIRIYIYIYICFLPCSVSLLLICLLICNLCWTIRYYNWQGMESLNGANPPCIDEWFYSFHTGWIESLPYFFSIKGSSGVLLWVLVLLWWVSFISPKFCNRNSFTYKQWAAFEKISFK